MFDAFLVLLVLVSLYYHMSHCGKCNYMNTRCPLCNYGKKHGEINKVVLEDMKKLEERHKDESL